MKKLILVRHAQLDHSNPMRGDIDHPLSKKGRREALEMAARFAELNIQPDLIVVSPAKRARETGEAFAKKLQIPAKELVLKKEVYEAERADILHIVHELDDSKQVVVIIGHNPGMISLVHHLVDSDVTKMPPGSVAILDIHRERWRQVAYGASTLDQFMAPAVKGVDHTSWRWRFMFWRRQRIEKVELFVVFLVGLLIIIGVITAIVSLSSDPAGRPQQGSAAQ